MYGQAEQEAYDKYLKQAKSRGWFATGNKESKDAMDAYAEAMGLNKKKGYEVTNYRGDGSIEYKYIDENGQE
jgi:hypothetical protein